MKVLSGKDAGSSVLADEIKPVDENPEPVKVNAADVSQDQMADALTKAVAEVDEAGAAKAKEAELKKKAEDERKDEVSISEHKAASPLLASLPETEKKTVLVTKDHRDRFCTCLITNDRYTERFVLFGGKATLTLRSRTLDETDAIEAYVRRKVASGDLSVTAEYIALVRKTLLLSHIEEFCGTKYEPMRDPLFYTEDETGRHAPGWVPQLEVWSKRPEAVTAAIMERIIEFETRYWYMVRHSDDENFWASGESTVV